MKGLFGGCGKSEELRQFGEKVGTQRRRYLVACDLEEARCHTGRAKLAGDLFGLSGIAINVAGNVDQGDLKFRRFGE